MNSHAPTRRRSWRRKFQDAFRGVWITVRYETSFWVHLIAAISVVLLAFVLDISASKWSVLMLCITLVMVSEIFNTVIEKLARAISSEYDPNLRDALDIASAAVLVASVGSVIVGGIVLLDELL